VASQRFDQGIAFPSARFGDVPNADILVLPGRGQSFAVHGWSYGLQDGLLRDLNTTVKDPAKVRMHYESAVKGE
jgi:hypothetical protein